MMAATRWTAPNAAGYRFPHESPCDCTACGEAMVAQRQILVSLSELDELDPSLAQAFRLDLSWPYGTATPDLATADLLRGMVERRKATR